MRRWQKINMNETVRYKLYPKGLEILRRKHEELCSRFPLVGEFEPPRVDAEGWAESQLWVLFECFGEYITIGGNQPIETTMMIQVSE